MLLTDGKLAVPQATKRFPDPRVRHFWDGEARLRTEYARTLETSELPWDVYFLYGRDAEWKEQPPPPSFWMDQIGMEKGTPFDAARLRVQVDELLKK